MQNSIKSLHRRLFLSWRGSWPYSHNASQRGSLLPGYKKKNIFSGSQHRFLLRRCLYRPSFLDFDCSVTEKRHWHSQLCTKSWPIFSCENSEERKVSWDKRVMTTLRDSFGKERLQLQINCLWTQPRKYKACLVFNYLPCTAEPNQNRKCIHLYRKYLTLTLNLNWN